jgi:hypothetical protein
MSASLFPFAPIYNAILSGKVKMRPFFFSALRRNLQCSLERDIRGRPSHHDLKIARHNPPVHVDVEQLEIFRCKLQAYGLGLSGFECHSLKPPELLEGG